MERPLWFDHFKFQSSQKGTTQVLSQAILRGQINSEEYLTWAQQTYNLPVIADDFFNHPGIVELYMVINEIWDQWGPTFMPVAVWDGTLILACLSPEGVPNELGPYKVSPVLCSAFTLAQEWKKHHKTLVLPIEQKKLDPTNGGIREFLEGLHSIFDKTIFFQVNEMEITPIDCLDFADEIEFPERVNIESPNPFRIALKTQKPFHGPVSPNQFNDQFFAKWNKSNYPTQLTVIPIVIDQVVRFLFAGFIFERAVLNPHLSLEKSLNKTNEIKDLIVNLNFHQDNLAS